MEVFPQKVIQHKVPFLSTEQSLNVITKIIQESVVDAQFKRDLEFLREYFLNEDGFKIRFFIKKIVFYQLVYKWNKWYGSKDNITNSMVQEAENQGLIQNIKIKIAVENIYGNTFPIYLVVAQIMTESGYEDRCLIIKGLDIRKAIYKN